MPQERTGQWFVHQNGQWVAAQPPTQIPPPPPPPANCTASTQPATTCAILTAAPQPAPRNEKAVVGAESFCSIWRSGLCFGWSLALSSLSLWQEEPMALLGVALQRFFSLVLMLISLSSAWSGTIVDIRVERVRVSGGDEDFDRWDNVRFAYVRRSNGRTKKTRAMPDWQVGDHLEKRRGEAQIQHVIPRNSR